MQAPTPRRAPRARRFVGIGAAALLAVPTALIATAPAHAAEPGSETFTASTATDWVVPAGVREVTITAVGGSGGNASGQHGGTGGLGASVESVLTVEPGDVLTIWAGQAGGNAGSGRNDRGVGGAGFTAGGNGGQSGASARPGAGGGGSSAVELNDVLEVVAGGGGGGGGRGLDDVAGDACRGGAGGAAGAAGASSWTNASQINLCSTQTGGAAGTSATDSGSNAADVSSPTILQRLLGGSGGGGAGAGAAGGQQTSGLVRTAGGGGGGGGASLGDTVGLAAAAGNGSVTVDFETAYITTLDVTSAPSSSVIGENVTFTAVVENTETDATPTGEVSFNFDGVGVFTAPLVATSTPGVAEATLERASTAIGTQWIDSDYIPAAGSPFVESFWTVAHIVERGESRTAVTVEPASAQYFDTVRATAKVSVVAPAVTTLDGVVVFWYGEDQNLGTFPVDPATGEVSVEFPANLLGEHRVFAAYANDSNLISSEDIAPLDTKAAATTTTLKAGATEVAKGGSVKFDVTVGSSVPAAAPLAQSGDVSTLAAAAVAVTPVQPAGVVRFTVGETVLGEVPLAANGTASFTTTALPVGSPEVVAHFVSSAPEFASSKSSAVKVTVKAAATAIASTGVDGTLLGGAGALAALLIAAGVLMVIRRKRAEA
jgi:hypothetical protein